MPQGVVTSEETKTKAIEELKMRKVSGVSAKGIGKKYGVNDSSVYNWMRTAEGKPYKKKAENKPESGGARTRAAYPSEFKAKVVEDYIQRSPGTFATDIARKHGIDRQRLEKWVRASRDGKLQSAAEPDRSAIERVQPTNGHAKQLSAQLHLSMGDAPPAVQVGGSATSLPLHLQLYVQRLEAQNKALRKMLQIAMEAI